MQDWSTLCFAFRSNLYYYTLKIIHRVHLSETKYKNIHLYKISLNEQMYIVIKLKIV